MLPTEPIDPYDPGGPGGPTTPAGIPGHVVFEETFTKQEASSILRVIAYASCSSPDDLQFTAYVGVDGSVYQQCAVNAILDTTTSHGAMPITLPAFITGLSAGVHTITFAIRNQEPDGALTILAGSVLEITELKQGAV